MTYTLKCHRCGAEVQRSRAWKHVTCKQCRKTMFRHYVKKVYNPSETHRAYQRRWYLEHKRNRAGYAVKFKYGISIDDRDAMLAAQGGTCAICGIVAKKWHIDHDHGTGEVRGILCQKCNMGLGCFADDSSLLAAAIDYLLRKERKCRRAA